VYRGDRVETPAVSWSDLGHAAVDEELDASDIATFVGSAAKRFREEGLAEVGIAELMTEAGLTVGGFYKYFGSRGDLVAEALGYTLEL
jgi:TetR/AcrR family transcriptional regulator, transcriptional repressor for nem operon